LPVSAIARQSGFLKKIQRFTEYLLGWLKVGERLFVVSRVRFFHAPKLVGQPPLAPSEADPPRGEHQRSAF
jgi:hypothetical protein